MPVDSKAEEECRWCPKEAEEPGQAERRDPAAAVLTSAPRRPTRAGGGGGAGDWASAAARGRGEAEGGGDAHRQGEAGGNGRGEGGPRPERHALSTDQTRARGDGVHGEEEEEEGRRRGGVLDGDDWWIEEVMEENQLGVGRRQRVWLQVLTRWNLLSPHRISDKILVYCSQFSNIL